MKRMKYDGTKEKKFWAQRYKDAATGWDVGYPTTPMKAYIDQLQERSLQILIPGAGNAYEAEYLFRQGFEEVNILDIAEEPLRNFATRVPEFPLSQIICTNFFEHQGCYDLILEQTFFCSFPPQPENRKAYADKCLELLGPGGRLVGVWFDFPVFFNGKQPPFGGSKEEYLSYFSPLFKVVTLKKCYNSIPPRMNKELFGIFEKKAGQ